MTLKAVPQDLDQIQQFANALLPHGAPEGSVAHLFALPSKRCLWASMPDDLAAMAASTDESGEDVYIGVALRRTGLGKLSRGAVSDCTYVIACGLDIDVGSDGHANGKKRFETPAAAMECVSKAVALPASITVHSGGGLHMWWLYHEPFDLAEPGDRNLAMNVAMEWNRRVTHVARESGGYSVDSVFDITRVLRIPGTRNRKIFGKPRLVHMLDFVPSRRYDPADLADALGLDPKKLKEKAITEATLLGETLKLDSNAEPDMKKLYALTENDEWFARLMRRDISCTRKLKDASPSGYDLAIANIVVRAGWTDQEVTDLLIWGRRKNGDDMKLREKYYSNTIIKAKQGHDGTMSTEKAIIARAESVRAEQIKEVRELDSLADRRTEVFSLLAKATGVDVVQIVSNGNDPARYRICLRNGKTLHVDTTDKLERQRTWVLLGIEANAKIPPSPLSAANWRLLVTYLSEVVQFERDDDALDVALDEYLERATDLSENASENRGAVLSARQPVILPDGSPAVHLSAFSRWLTDNGRKTEHDKLKARMRDLGYAARTLGFAINGAKSSRTYWVGPRGHHLRNVVSDLTEPVTGKVGLPEIEPSSETGRRRRDLEN